MKKYIAEAYGTAVYTLVGCATAMVGVRYFGNLGIALAFGVTFMAMYYSFAHISGAHINPAVTLAHASSGRMKWIEAWKYMLSQVLGALIASLVLYAVAIGTIWPDNVTFLAQNNVKNGYFIQVAFIAEFLASLIFIKLFLAVSEKKHAPETAWLVLGLMIVALHFVTMPITGTSLNPARSLWPAVFIGGEHLKEVWVFVAAPLLAWLVAGACHKWFEKLK